jgi:16S rRNA (guanine966-N2)-methyltransferase
VREAIASAIESRGGFEGARVLDLFAGTGAMAFEALSRGADHAVLVEGNPKIAKGIAQAATSLGLTDRVTVLVADLRSNRAYSDIASRKNNGFDRIFVDPPYSEIDLVTPLLSALRDRGALKEGAILAIEHAKRHAPTRPEGFSVLSESRYGDTAVVLWTLDSTPNDENA